MNERDIFLLLADGDGTTHSSDFEFGVAVTSESEAERFVSEGGVGYTHSYVKIRIFENKDEAIRWRYPR